jgi:Xaa-Pro aminopeptidase
VVTATDVLPDQAELRAARRERVLAEMELADVDILITGREPNARYVAGVPRLWIAGSRPFGPGCLMTRSGAIHLVSTWDEGVPDDIPHENLHGITFNGANTLAWLQQVEGAASARVVATDGLMPSTARLIQRAFPEAELVDGEALMRRARRIKLPDEVAAIREAVRVAERALAAARAALVVGVTERQLTAVFMEEMAAAGVTTPTTQDVAWITSRDEAWTRANRDVAVAADDLVVFDAGVMSGGYIGEVGCTESIAGVAVVAGDLATQSEELWDRLMAACQPGASATGLLEAYDAAKLPPPPQPVAHGLGHGNDLPLVTHALPRTAAEQVLEPGMVLAVNAYVWQAGVGAVYRQEAVLITDSGPEVLSEARSPIT